MPLAVPEGAYNLDLGKLGHMDALLFSHFMICHSKNCHRHRTSSCHKGQRGGTNNNLEPIRIGCGHCVCLTCGVLLPVWQVLFSLVGHAIRCTTSGVIKISASQSHSSAEVVVADTGMGFTEEKLKELLQPFGPSRSSSSGDQRASEDEAQRGPKGAGAEGVGLGGGDGYGLGLYLVQQCLDALGSKLKVNTEVSRGSTFSFVLPLSDDVDLNAEDERSSEGYMRLSFESTVGGDSERVSAVGLILEGKGAGWEGGEGGRGRVSL